MVLLFYVEKPSSDISGEGFVSRIRIVNPIYRGNDYSLLFSINSW